ncbi:hypothetical protein Syun_020139 [Stephania yunnanensis]|uniref:U5 small nuclear ribonucleoprotein TSSC4 n=1 Tax=Stephania yunnanensis TaxID=152371 RepID=A0AAP0IEN3_9MAGN
MDDTFKARVDKVFGSLSSAPHSSLRSLWSLTDEEVEKREWNRESSVADRDETLERRASSERKLRGSRGGFDEDLEDLSDDDDDDDDGEDGGDEGSNGRSEEGRDEWDVRASIGLDRTLDNEEEEDEYDKVAVGRENAEERLYLKDVTDHGDYLNSYNVLPDSFKDHNRDLRANHMAARIRLKEDSEAAKNGVSLPASDCGMPDAERPQVTEDCGNLKSILKRKVDQTDTKVQKRVRFDPEFKDFSEVKEEEEEIQDSPMAACPIDAVVAVKDASSSPHDTVGVPDYVRNPSKYTKYSFDSTTDIDESSNKQACMDFLDMIKKSKTLEMNSDDVAADISKTVTFIPRKKAGDVTSAKSIEADPSLEDFSKESLGKTSARLTIAAREAEESEVCAMEEDEPKVESESRSNKSQKPARKYRAKS